MLSDDQWKSFVDSLDTAFTALDNAIVAIECIPPKQSQETIELISVMRNCKNEIDYFLSDCEGDDDK